MNDLDLAAQYCEERKMDALSTIVPKTVEANAIIFIWDRNGQVIKKGTLMHIAAYCGAIDCIKYLLDYSADFDKRDEVLFSKFISFFFIFLWCFFYKFKEHQFIWHA